MPKLSPEIEAAIQRTAQAQGVDPAKLRAFVMIESGGNPNNTTGSYKGLLQLSKGEFAKHGGQGSIYDVDANLNAGAIKLRAESADFERRYGRQPSAGELYMMHQQGVGGSANHWANPDKPAWQNMYETAEGRQKGPGWARQAIWGNVPSDVRRQYGSVDNITSGQFTDLWNTKVARFGGGSDNPPAAQPQAPSYSVAGAGGRTPATASPSPAPSVAAATQPPGGVPSPASGGGAGSSPSFSSVLASLTTPSASGGSSPLGALGSTLGSLAGSGGDSGGGGNPSGDLLKSSMEQAEKTNAEYDRQHAEIVKRILARRKEASNGLVG